MGNCMETYTMKPMEMEQQKEEETKTTINDDNKGKNGVSMKIVLTKEELKWLIFQLNNKGMKVEQVLQEIEKGRQKIEEGWKPSLESILEAPEILEIN
ncbi:uncharacterized protein LOC123904718 [Trifolium pratense]|uniref:uncharacterized protein LOC123904718 n=1 Tax=Trifolium pratense TaxID=57577 RepID=UPI001E692F1B|nr:uncharacterized protein LOC123904718 [Trifolium pratense]